jgi:hypothetical protein
MSGQTNISEPADFQTISHSAGMLIVSDEDPCSLGCFMTGMDLNNWALI